MQKKTACIAFSTLCKVTILAIVLLPHIIFSQQKDALLVSLNQMGTKNTILSKRTGLWSVTETSWAYPGAPPIVSNGLVAERIMVGLMLQEFIRPLNDTLHRDVKRTDLLTFNQLESRWNYVSFDTRVPLGLMPAWGNNPGDGSKIELDFAPFAVVSEEKDIKGQLIIMNQSITFLDADNDVKDQYFMLANGKGQRWLGRRYSFVRIK